MLLVGHPHVGSNELSSLEGKCLNIYHLFSYALIGVAVGGASWYLSRLARGPTSALQSNVIASCVIASDMHVFSYVQLSGPRTTRSHGIALNRMSQQSS